MPDLPGFIRDERMLLALRYEGPWERTATWLFAIDWRTGEIWKEVEHGPRSWLACWADRRDAAWRTRWAWRHWRTGKNPGDRWRRRFAQEQED